MIDIESLLNEKIDPQYLLFHSNLVPGKTIRGIRTNDLQQIANQIFKKEGTAFLDQKPQNDYEFSVIYGMQCARKELSFSQHIHYLEKWLKVNDNWACNDLVCTRQKWIRHRKKEMEPFLLEWFKTNNAWNQRFVYTTLLAHYKKEEDLPFIQSVLHLPYQQTYYTQMGLAWLLCELLIRYPCQTESLLLRNQFDPFTVQKAFQKAIESNRISPETKNKYRLLKQTLKKEQKQKLLF